MIFFTVIRNNVKWKKDGGGARSRQANVDPLISIKIKIAVKAKSFDPPPFEENFLVEFGIRQFFKKKFYTSFPVFQIRNVM